MLSAIVRSENEPSTVCSDVAPNLIHSSPKPRHDAAGDHRIEHAAARLVAHAMVEIAARADFLDRREVAALVMHARESVAHELLRDVRDAVAVALRRSARP